MCNFILIPDEIQAPETIDWVALGAECREDIRKEKAEHDAINAKAEARGWFRHSEPKSIYSQPGRAPNPPGLKHTAWKAPTPKHERSKQRFAQR